MNWYGVEANVIGASVCSHLQRFGTISDHK
jgi:hypothetical protein